MAYIDRAFLPQQQTEQERFNAILQAGAKAAMNDAQIIAVEIKEFMSSKERKSMLTGEQYYRNFTDIQNKRRLMSDGSELMFRKNTKLEHAFYKKIVDQISGYLMTKQPSIMPIEEDKIYSDAINTVLNRHFWKTFTRAGRCAINQAVTWLQPFINSEGKLQFSYIPGYEVIPLWRDNAHTELDAVIRTYDVIVYEGRERKIVTKAEYWTTEGVLYYVYNGERIIPDVEMTEQRGNAHFMINNEPYVWDKIPFICVKYNDIEQPLIDVLKSNIDTYNHAASTHADLLADIPSSLIAVKGYGGDPDRVLYDIFQSRIALLQPDSGSGVEIIQNEPQTESVETMLTRIRRDIFSFGAGVDGQDEGANNRSGEAQKHKRADLDTICNNFEIELQESMQSVLWFVNQYLLMSDVGDFTDTEVTVVFNRDIVVQESETIKDCMNSVGLVSKRTILSNHPWVEDVDMEMQELDKEMQEEQTQFELQASKIETGGADE
jgi:SPP1 family phage portal protein